jgi:tetratricopeptide (TPR) repeat protein
MGKVFVPATARTPAGRVRKTLDLAELRIANLRHSGPQALELLHLLDQVAQGLGELEESGMDVRAEQSRFETVQRQLERQQRRFLAEAGAALHKERAAAQPDRAHPWWFLDEMAARQRQRQLRRLLTWGTVALLILAGGWFAYDRFIAPPPEVGQAFQHTATGEALVEEGDLQAALAEFAAAAALTPDDPQPWLWQGIIHFAWNELDEAQRAFDTARTLYGTDFDFLMDRSLAYLRLGDLDAAGADIEQAITEAPQDGRAYFVRAVIAAEQGNHAMALADLEQATELAREAGDTELEAAARTQWAMMVQLQAYPQITPTP